MVIKSKPIFGTYFVLVVKISVIGQNQICTAQRYFSIVSEVRSIPKSTK